MNNLQKTFNWENYTQGRQTHKFSDFTDQELKDWSAFWGFNIQKIKNDVFVCGGKNKVRIKVK